MTETTTDANQRLKDDSIIPVVFAALLIIQVVIVIGITGLYW